MRSALLSGPRTYKEAIKQPDAEQWKEAINTELAQLEILGDGAKKTRTLFKKKMSKTGAVEHWKARMVAQGFLQSFGIDFYDTYAPGVHMISF